MMMTLLHILLTFLDSLEFKRTQTDLKDILLLLSKVIHKIDKNFKMIPQKRGGQVKSNVHYANTNQENNNNNSLPSIFPSSPLGGGGGGELGNTFPFPGRNSPSATL